MYQNIYTYIVRNCNLQSGTVVIKAAVFFHIYISLTTPTVLEYKSDHSWSDRVNPLGSITFLVLLRFDYITRRITALRDRLTSLWLSKYYEWEKVKCEEIPILRTL